MPLTEFRWVRYFSDTGGIYAVKILGIYVDQDDRGWGQLALETDPQLPRAWRERRVTGITANGQIVHAEVAQVGAALWTGSVSSFVVRSQSGSLVGATVIGRQQERSLQVH